MIAVGDLNFALSTTEICGDSSCSNQLTYFFNRMLVIEDLMDIQPSIFYPTWRNGKGGQSSVSKRLYHFLAYE